MLIGRRVWEQLAVGQGALRGLLPPDPLKGRPGQEELLEFVEVVEPAAVCAQW